MPKFIVTAFVFLSIVVARGADEDTAKQMLLGVWNSNDTQRHIVVLRDPDGTYREKGFAIYAVDEPPVKYEAIGIWRVKGKVYSVKIKKYSSEILDRYKHKFTHYPVIYIKRVEFKYLSPDDADRVERKVNGGSEKSFSEAVVVPFPPPPEMKVRKGLKIGGRNAEHLLTALLD